MNAEFDRQKKCYDSYESQCTSAPTTEAWTSPLKYAMDSILQDWHAHGVFSVHVSAATGIFYEQIHETYVDQNGYSVRLNTDVELPKVHTFNFVVPYSTEIHNVSGIIDHSMLEQYEKNKDSFDEFVKDSYSDVVNVPTYCATYPTREYETARNDTELKSSKILAYANLGKWWQFARSKILIMESVLQQTKTLRACALVEDFTETYYSQPNIMTLMQITYYHTLKEVLNLPHTTQLTEHVLHEFVADVIVSRLAICLDKASELATSAISAQNDLKQALATNNSSNEDAVKTMKEDAKTRFEEWRTAVLYYAANDIEHALSTLVLYWRDSYILNLMFDRICPTVRLNDSPGRSDDDPPLCPICAFPMSQREDGPCLLNEENDDSTCAGPFFQCRFHDKTTVCSNHKTKKFIDNIPLFYRNAALIVGQPEVSGIFEDPNLGCLVDVGTWRYSPLKHTKEIIFFFYQEVADNGQENKGPTPITFGPGNSIFKFKINPLIKVPLLFEDSVCASLLPSRRSRKKFGETIKIVTFRAKEFDEDGDLSDFEVDSDNLDYSTYNTTRARISPAGDDSFWEDFTTSGPEGESTPLASRPRGTASGNSRIIDPLPESPLSDQINTSPNQLNDFVNQESNLRNTSLSVIPEDDLAPEEFGDDYVNEISFITSSPIQNNTQPDQVVDHRNPILSRRELQNLLTYSERAGTTNRVRSTRNKNPNYVF